MGTRCAAIASLRRHVTCRSTWNNIASSANFTDATRRKEIDEEIPHIAPCDARTQYATIRCLRASRTKPSCDTRCGSVSLQLGNHRTDERGTHITHVECPARMVLSNLG